jgi:hypothetical protein
MANKPTPTMAPTKTSTTDAMPCAPPINHSGDEPGKHHQKDGPREAQKGYILRGKK